MITDVLPLIFTTDLEASAGFYRDALGLVVVFHSDWYIHLHGPNQPTAQLAMIDGDHDSIPQRFRAAPQGVGITIETDDVDAVHVVASEFGVQFHVPLRDEPWGQRHFVTEDPTGLMVDVVQAIE